MGDSEWQIAEQSGALHRGPVGTRNGGHVAPGTDRGLGADVGVTEETRSWLARQLQALEDSGRIADGAREADLETLGSAGHLLVRTVRTGRRAQSALLSGEERAALRRTIEQYHTALEQRQQYRDAAFVAARVLARTERTDTAHHQAAQDFERSICREKVLTERLTALGGRAANARAELDEDDTARAMMEPVLNAGDEAERQLKRLLRARLAAVIRVREMLPRWLVAALGPVPTEKAETWMNLAVRILLYRAVFSITDAAALGPQPAGDAVARTDEYEKLATALRRWS